MSNVFKTALLLAVLTAMLVLLGGAIGGRHGMAIALVMATGGALVLRHKEAPPMEDESAEPGEQLIAA